MLKMCAHEGCANPSIGYNYEKLRVVGPDGIPAEAVGITITGVCEQHVDFTKEFEPHA